MARKRELNSTDEIEITPAMIEAGCRELACYNGDYEGDDDAVIRIFDAMFRVYHSLREEDK